MTTFTEPVTPPLLPAEIDAFVLFLDVGRRQEVVMHVDALCDWFRRRRLGKDAARGEGGRGG